MFYNMFLIFLALSAKNRKMSASISINMLQPFFMSIRFLYREDDRLCDGSRICEDPAQYAKILSAPEH